MTNGEEELVLVPGHIGNRAALQHLQVRPEQIVDVSNEWGFILARLTSRKPKRLLLVGHPGKLAKLANGDWQTHSSQTASPLPLLKELCRELQLPAGDGQNTVEELFMSFLDEDQRRLLAERTASAIRSRIAADFPGLPEPTVVLINLAGEVLGSSGHGENWPAAVRAASLRAEKDIE